jgi:Ca-activated chloride channel homolog
LRVGLLIDASNSVIYRFPYEQKAASLFLKRMLHAEGDKAFLVTFNDRVNLLQDMTGDLGAMKRSIRHAEAGGNTALYDAVVFACSQLTKSAETLVTRKVIILISDGVDTKSRSTIYDAQQAAMRSGVLMLALSTNEPIWNVGPEGDGVLDRLTRPTGGSLLPAHYDWQLWGAFAKVQRLLRNQYFIAYAPPAFAPDGSYRSVQVIPRDSRLQAHCREGYYARLERGAR